MKLFECTYRENHKFYERYFCTTKQQSELKRIDIPYEWYEPNSTGSYYSISDHSIKLTKKQGSAKEARDNYGVLDPMYRNIRDNYWGTNGDYNQTPRTWSLDIETRVGTAIGSTGFPVPQKALEPISLMQFYDNKLNTMFVLGMRDWVHENDYKFEYAVKYIKCKDEIHLLEVYLGLFKKLNPLIIYAWNGDGFDFPYIFNRMKNLNMCTDALSNYGDCSLTESSFQGRTEFKLNANGHYYLDVLPIYKKFTFQPRPNYSLDTIAEVELKENKVLHTEYAAFDDFYTGKYIIPDNPTEEQRNSKIYKAAIAGDTELVKELAHSEFVYYGAVDTYLLQRIVLKRNFTELLLSIASKMGVQISDATGTVKPWSQFISNTSHGSGAIMPPKKEHDQPQVVGGYVREVERGKHHWVLSADVSSMYPLLGMVGFNMSPETFIPKHKLSASLRDIVLSTFNDQDEGARLDLTEAQWETITEQLKTDNVSLAINGAVFNNDKEGMIPALVKSIYAERKAAKSRQFKYEQRKILIQELING